MKTAEETLKDNDVSIDKWPDTKIKIIEAMKEYAKQAIEAQREQDKDLAVGESRKEIANAPLVELK